MRLASISSVALGTLNIRESDMRAAAPVVYSPAHSVFPIEMVAVGAREHRGNRTIRANTYDFHVQ